MKVLVAGGTGAIGRPLIAGLLAKGYKVAALTRSEEKAELLKRQGVETAIVDVFDAESVKAAFARVKPDAVVEQLTALPRTYTRESMAAASPLNDRLRLEGGANVLAAAKSAGVQKYLRQSIAFWAIPGEGLADEETPLALDGPPAVGADAQLVTEIERRLWESANIEGIAMRYGFFYGPGTWFNPDGDVAEQVRKQQFPVVGSGTGVWSWLHIEDAARATIAAVEKGRAGKYLIANDEPVPVSTWLPAFARWIGAPAPPQISVEEALGAGGADAVYYGTQMRGVSNAKAKRELGFQPRRLEWIDRTAASPRNSPIDTSRVVKAS